MSGESVLQAQQQTGASIWTATRRTAGEYSDAIAWDVAWEALNGSLDGGNNALQTTALAAIVAATAWVDGGCRTITTNAAYFSAMAATSVAPEVIASMRPHWRAFAVELPAGLLVTSSGTEYRAALVADLVGLPSESGEPWDRSWMFILGNDGLCLHAYSFDRAKLLTEKTDLIDTGLEVDAGEPALIALTKRAVAGLLLTLEHTANFRTKSFPPVTRGRYRDTPPPHRTIFIGRPIQVDVTQAVRDVCAAKPGASPPSVQTLVRGHMKRQVVGIGRTGRKVIWIEPYWRGPEDAPILARPYKVGPKEAT